MKSNQLATLVLRLIAVYGFVQSVPMIGMFGVLVTNAGFSKDGSMLSAWVSALFPGVSMLLVSILVFAFAPAMGRRLASAEAGEVSLTGASFDQVQILVFAAVGLLIFADSLPSLISSLNYLCWWLGSLGDHEARQELMATRPGLVREFSASFGIILKAALGLWLFFGARGFVNLFRFLRSAGTHKPA